MSHQKPMLSVEQQIAHLESKGITFELMSKAEAAGYLATENNILRTASYREVFFKHEEGSDTGKYMNLDFAYLAELADIDRVLREVMVVITLDIEHYAKVKILDHIAKMPGEDGYAIVADFIATLPERFRNGLDSEMRSRASVKGGDTYCGALIAKYHADMPVWVLLEVISFGTFLAFYRFCSQRWSDRTMLLEYYLMKKVKSVRNAACHGSCIINGFRLGMRTAFSTTSSVTAALSKGGVRKSKNRSAKLENPIVQQIVTTLYAHHSLVDSEKAKARAAITLQALKARFMEHGCWFSKNNVLVSFFQFIGRVIDIWFPLLQDDGTRKKL